MRCCTYTRPRQLGTVKRSSGRDGGGRGEKETENSRRVTKRFTAHAQLPVYESERDGANDDDDDEDGDQELRKPRA